MRTRLFAACSLALVLTACGKQADEPKEFGSYIPGKSSNPDDPELWHRIDAAVPSGTLMVLKEWNTRDNVRESDKGEFEKNEDYLARIQKERQDRIYKGDCYAFVTDGDFEYDADTEVATFFEKADFQNKSTTTHHMENVSFPVPVGQSAAKLSAKVPIDFAKRMTHGHDDGEAVRIVRVFSLRGQSAPAFNGWDTTSSFFQYLDAMNDKDFRDFSRKIMDTPFEVRGSLVRVRVLPPTNLSSDKPLFSWSSGKGC